MGALEKSNASEIRYEYLRPDQIIEARNRVPIAFVPLAPLEWHAPHLPIGTDVLHAYVLALNLAQEFGGLVLPPLPIGSETVLEPDRVRDRGFKGDEKIVGMDFPGLSLPSLYIEESAFGAGVHEVVRGLKRQGFRLIVMVNGHGGKYHLVQLDRIAAEESEPGQVLVIHGFPIDPKNTSVGGHAEKYETSIIKYVYPETVDLAALPPLPTPLKVVELGILDAPTCDGQPTPDFTVRENQDPRFASPEMGKEGLAAGLRVIGDQIRAALKTLNLSPAPQSWVREVEDGSMKNRYEYMRPKEIIAAREKAPIAYLPIGPLEWHGPHLPYGQDMIHAYTVAHALAKEFGGLVLPPLPFGSESVLEADRVRDRGFRGDEKIWGMDFPGLPLPSLYVADNAMGVVIHELVRGLKAQKFRVIALVNGHGGKYHVETLKRIAAEESEPGAFAVIFAFAFDVSPGKGGHAERYETGFSEAYYPNTVNLKALPPSPEPIKNVETGILDGPTCLGQPTSDFSVRPEQDPRNATVEDGYQDVRNGVERLGAQIRQGLVGVGLAN
jgi:creatinine amidohydrolase